MKECFVCLETKPLDEFYAHPGMSDGHLNKCKVCNRIQSEQRRKKLESTSLEWKEFELARHRAKADKFRKEGRSSKTKYQNTNEWRRRNREKANAHSVVGKAVKLGELIPKLCFCGEQKVEAHHEDYSKPLDIIWLCHKHHMDRHVEINKQRRLEEFLNNNESKEENTISF